MKEDVSDEDLILIGHYLRGELSQTELNAFRERMLNDRDFAEEVEQAVALAKIVSSKEHARLKKQMKGDREAAVAEEKARRQLRRMMTEIAAASVVILLVCILCMLYKSPNELHGDRIVYMTDAIPSAYDLNHIGQKQTPHDAVIRAYTEERYWDCTTEFERQEHPSALATFCAANAYLTLGQHDDAIYCFRKANELARQDPDIEGASAYYADMLSLERLDLNTAEQVVREMHTKTPIKPNVQMLLALKYIKGHRFQEADSVVSQMEDVDWEFRAQVKLLKWRY